MIGKRISKFGDLTIYRKWKKSEEMNLAPVVVGKSIKIAMRKKVD